MRITYIHHSGFLVETDSCYYLFDYETGQLPKMDVVKPIFVCSSHAHEDHYNPEVLDVVAEAGMKKVYAILSDDIEVRMLEDGDAAKADDKDDAEGDDGGINVSETVADDFDVNVMQVSAGHEYDLGYGQKLTTFKSTDEGVAFLIEEGGKLIYHAGDLNDWIWEGESYAYNKQMTKDYRKEIELLAEKLAGRKIDVAFVVLDPRQQHYCDRGMCYFLENVGVEKVYPMHYWDKPTVIDDFVKEHPEYTNQIQRTE